MTGFALVVTLALVGPAAAPAQNPPPSGSSYEPDVASGENPPLRAMLLEDEPDLDLDGRLSEAFWENAEPASDFTQQDPAEGAEPSERTEIRVVYDADALYIGAMLYDDPEAILAYQKRRDESLGTDDRFMWILDTFRDGRTGYFFEINANGLMGDGLIGGGGGRRVNKSWDGIWEAQVARTPDGWSAEIRIPFQTLNFNPTDDTWGINFQRTIRRRNEEILWRGWRRNQGLFNPVFAGRMTGLQGLSQGLGIEVRPYATQRWRNDPGDPAPHSYPRDVGVDVGYSITPGLRAAVSWNTDFAEAEVDQRQVNLSRFPLRFPEQRDFFLEGSGVYTFAPRSGPEPYFSRRIGLEGGVPVPIQYAARLGGQAGRWELGFIQAGTERLSGDAGLAAGEVLPGETFTVARAKRTILSQSSIGGIFTRRATSAGPGGEAPPDRYTVGADLDFNTATFLGDQNMALEAFFVWNSNPERGTDRSLSELTARGFRFNFPNEYWQAHLSYREFGDHYQPAVGFVRRNNFRRVEPRVAWRPRIESVSWIRRFTWDLQYRQLNDLKTGELLERTWDIGLFEVDFESQDRFGLQLTRRWEFLDRTFEVSEGIPIQPGDYVTWNLRANFNTARYRPVSIQGRANYGDFWDGDRTSIGAEVTIQPRPGYRVSAGWERNDITLPAGSFVTNLMRVEGGWDISPWASLSGNVQYDDVTELVGLFGLLRWIVTPGNEVFLVYTHNWQRLDPAIDPGDPQIPGADPRFGDRPFETLSQGATIKVNYTWRW